MTRHRIAVILIAVSASFPIHPVAAQCVPGVQRLIDGRKFDAARTQLDAQLARVPNNDAAMNCMGRLLLDKGELGDAVDWLEKAVAVKGKSAQHHMWLGLALRAKAQQANMLSQAVLGARMKTELERLSKLELSKGVMEKITKSLA